VPTVAGFPSPGVKLQKNIQPTTNVKRYPAEMVNPPDGVKAADWIAGGFKK
jgi:hypothetical protein